ncbi:MAG: hypothetical protein ACKO38_10650 [Planctomycetota bacterium]
MLAIPLILAGVSGFALIELLHPRRTLDAGSASREERSAATFELVLRLGLGLGLGMSLQSVLAYLSLVLTGSLTSGLAVETLLGIAGCILLVVRGQRKASVLVDGRSDGSTTNSTASAGTPIRPAGAIVEAHSPAWVEWMFTLSLVVSVAVLAALPIIRWSQAPHGYWDAWQMWTPKAMILFRGGPEWSARISSFNDHPGYPLLVPLTTARLWTWVGTPFHLGSAFANSYLYAMAIPGVLVGFLGMTGGKRAAVFAVSAFCVVPAFPAWTAALYADLQVSFHVVALLAIVAWTMSTSRSSAGLAALAGIAMGGVLWSKNEGVMLSLAAVPAIALTQIAKDGWRRSLPSSVGLVCGLAPFLICLGHFKQAVAPAGEMAAALLSSKAADLLVDVDRWRTVCRHGWRLIRQENLPLLAVILAGLVWCRRPNRVVRTSLALASFPLLASLGYLYVYLRTPHELDWHLATSLSRIFLHVYPAALLVFIGFFLSAPRGLAPPSSSTCGPTDEVAAEPTGGESLPLEQTPTRAAWLAAIALLTLVPPTYQAFQFDQQIEPRNWKKMHQTVMEVPMGTLRRMIGESESISIAPTPEKGQAAELAKLAAQYRLAPRKVTLGGDSPWVIAFHKSVEESRKFAVEQSLTPIHDLRNGMRLYHRGPLESDTASGPNRTFR